MRRYWKSISQIIFSYIFSSSPVPAKPVPTGRGASTNAAVVAGSVILLGATAATLVMFGNIGASKSNVSVSVNSLSMLLFSRIFLHYKYIIYI